MAAIVRFKMYLPERNHVLSLHNDEKSLSEISAMIESVGTNVESIISKYRNAEKKKVEKTAGHTRPLQVKTGRLSE